MNKYREAAIEAAKLLISKTVTEPLLAWNIATSNIFGKNTSAQKKGCPKGAFLGLCEHGLIKGVQVGSYTDSSDNKLYAIKGVKALKENPFLINDIYLLWIKATGNKNIKHNSQMDVVIALWNEGLIK
ncbi:MAG: hypothetical protein FJW69_06355 [Actinobacteria bacterium]|nr:hypothetical protein [Actinomycetota bacterium]MBM3712289.1 hypothetical protein [Actinomycetota bacterium]